MKVPLIDLQAQHKTIEQEVNDAIQNVIRESAFAGGPFVAEFERHFADAHGAKFCVGVNSGTSALHLALWALGIGKGDEVIVPANTFFATPESVSLCGATPVFVDCEPNYYNLDPERIKNAITPRTKAIIAVHLYGQPARIDAIKAVADEHGIQLIEDCAQAHLAQYKGRKVGTFGIAGCFSFYPGKNLGAYGEAGAVITNDENLCQKMRCMRDHGSEKRYYHDCIGHNYRMEGIQAAVLDVKLKHLEGWTEKRRGHADVYRKYLQESNEIVLPREMEDAKHVYHLFVVRVPERDRVVRYLAAHSIGSGIHYPVPCHLQKAYADLPKPPKPIGPLHISETYAKSILSLPMYPELSEDIIYRVCEVLLEGLQQ